MLTLCFSTLCYTAVDLFLMRYWHVLDANHLLDPYPFTHSHLAWLAVSHSCVCVCVCFRVCPGVPAGAPRDHPGHLGWFNRRAWQGARVQMAICLPEIPPRQLLPHHALPLQRVLCKHGSAAGLWVLPSVTYILYIYIYATVYTALAV